MSDETTAQNGALPLSTLSDDDTLALTRGIRVNVIHELMPQGKLPGDNSDRITLNNMLEGLDRQAMGSKRLLADQKSADNTAILMSELLRGLNKSTAFQGIHLPGHNNTIDVEARVVPASVPNMPALPGEMDVAAPQLDYASFVRSQGKDADQIGKDVKHAESDDGDDIP
jgi:hypothetical protein